MDRIVPLLLLAVAVGACRDELPTVPATGPLFAKAANNPTHQVSGGGTVVREDIPGSPREVYGFNAQIDAAGNVRGEAEVHFPSDNVNMHIDVQCLAIERNWAWMSGPVTRSDNPSTRVGTVFLWQVQDNGEGHGAPPDRISNFIYKGSGNYAPDVCKWKPALTTFPWDNGNVRIMAHGGLSLADLVGTWDAEVYLVISVATPADTFDLLAGGQAMRMTVAPDGAYSVVDWVSGRIFNNVAGTMDVVNGMVVQTIYGKPGVPVFALTRSGNTLYGETEWPAYDFDGDGNNDPSRIVVSFRLKKTGTLVGDLAGTWDATIWRYTSASTPTKTVDLVAAGTSITVTIGLDSRFTVMLAPGGTSTSEFLVEGSQMLTRNDSPELPKPEERAYTFALDRNIWSFAGLDTFDFDGDPATPKEPATLQVVLVRQ